MTAITTIFSNKEFSKAAKNLKRSEWAHPMVQYEPDAVIELIAAYRRMEPEDLAAKMSPLTLPVGLLQVMNDPEMVPLFTSASQTTADESSGSHTESTGETGEI